MLNCSPPRLDGLLASDIDEALGDLPTLKAVRSLFIVCHKMATAYVKTKIARGTFCPSRLGMDPEDFALDAIAELFRQDRGPRLDGFKCLHPKLAGSSEDASLHIELRRIVLGAVNQRIFRSFLQSDPTLAHLIRNIKETVSSIEHGQAIRWQGTVLLAPRTKELLHDRPFYPEELFQIELSSLASRALNLRRHLECVLQILSDQSTYRRAYPLTGLALLMRSILVESEGTAISSPKVESITEREIRESIDSVVGEISRCLLSAYLRKQKIDPREAVGYKNALREVLVMTYIQRDGHDRSFFSILSDHVGSLQKADYKMRHRAKFEYAVKRSRVALDRQWKSELGFRQTS
jgi:hypothetical protein